MMWYKKILYFFCSTCRPNSSLTVRFAFPVLLGALAFFGALTIGTETQTTIEIVPSKTTVKDGENLTLDVYVTAHKPINAVDISLNVPSTQLSVTGIDTGESVITLWAVDPYFKDNTVVLRGGTFRKGFLGKHLIATINAKATATGLAYVNVSKSLLLAGDGTGSEVSSVKTDAEKVKLFIAASDGTLNSNFLDTVSTFSANAQIGVISDIDGDGDVSLSDISRFMSAWRNGSDTFDFNGDGKMTFRDFAIILADSFFK